MRRFSKIIKHLTFLKLCSNSLQFYWKRINFVLSILSTPFLYGVALYLTGYSYFHHKFSFNSKCIFVTLNKRKITMENGKNLIKRNCLAGKWVEIVMCNEAVVSGPKKCLSLGRKILCLKNLAIILSLSTFAWM